MSETPSEELSNSVSKLVELSKQITEAKEVTVDCKKEEALIKAKREETERKAIKSKKVNKIYNLGSGKKTSINTIAKIFGGKKKFIPARVCISSPIFTVEAHNTPYFLTSSLNFSIVLNL